jgi:hypothetical protein
LRIETADRDFRVLDKALWQLLFKVIEDWNKNVSIKIEEVDE